MQFAAVGAAIAGVSLVIEDFITWLQGGESVIGDIVNAFSNWMDKFPELKEDLKSVGQVFADVFNAIPGLIDKCICLLYTSGYNGRFYRFCNSFV